LNDVAFEQFVQTDITTIFANLLDNAIEATMKLNEDRKINVTARKFGDIISLSIVNTFDVSTIVNIDNIKSSKGDRNGIGIPNVKKAVAKYNGTLSIEAQCGVFVANIILPCTDY
jgi:two-component system sensor histidine kinase AgrC